MEETKKPTGLFKHLHTFWSKSRRSKVDNDSTSTTSYEADAVRNRRSDDDVDVDSPKINDEKTFGMVMSESNSSISLFQSPRSRLTLTRESSISINAPERHDVYELQQETAHVETESQPTDEQRTQPMMQNGNESQLTLLDDARINPEKATQSVLARQASFKRRDVTSPTVTQKTKLRRTHSMFVNKREVELDKELIPTYDSFIPSSEIPIYSEENTNDNLPRISVGTLVEILNGRYTEYYQDVFVIDCRFEYEFQGGHIKNAINISRQKQLEHEFIHKRHIRCYDSNKPPLVVFHCEFSSYRGPIMASHLRTCDRILNHDSYPKLHYPDILILDGGFKTFFDSFPRSCEGEYVCMSSKNHEVELSMFKRDSKRLMTRANSAQMLQLSEPIKNCQLDVDSSENSNGNDNDNEDYDLPLNMNINVPPRLCLERYGEMSSSNRSNSSKSSIASNSSKLMLMEELNGFGPRFLESDEYDCDLDQYSLDLGDDDEDRNTNDAAKIGFLKPSPSPTISNRKNLFPELINANK